VDFLNEGIPVLVALLVVLHLLKLVDRKVTQPPPYLIDVNLVAARSTLTGEHLAAYVGA
jgi:hypothetical protein